MHSDSNKRIIIESSYLISHHARNVTIPDVTWEQQCRDVESVRKSCETNYEVENVTMTEQVCNDVMVEECYNYTVPTYEVVCRL